MRLILIFLFLLILFSAQKTEKLKQIDYLVNDDETNLLYTLNDREVAEYASNELDMISKDDEVELIDALDYLNYNWIDQVDEDEMINYLEDNGYTIKTL